MSWLGRLCTSVAAATAAAPVVNPLLRGRATSCLVRAPRLLLPPSPASSAGVRLAPFSVTANRAAGSYYSGNPGDALWKSNTSVSSVGGKRGRAKKLGRRRDLNRGQRLGFGPAKMIWPGLTTGVTTPSRTVPKLGSEMKDEEYTRYQNQLKEIQTGVRGRGFKKDTPLQRGWTSARSGGKKYPGPENYSPAVNYKDFVSVMIEQKQVCHMTGNLGRLMTISNLLVTGNQNGLAGFALARTATGRKRVAHKNAIRKAGLRLCEIKLYESRTVYHDFFTQFGSTRIIVRQKPPGYGIEAHRAIKAACEVIGIKDLYAEIEGSKNYLHIIKAFFLGLMRQRTHQELADEKKLHLIELRPENDNYPRLVASPSDGKARTKKEILPNEVLDFEMVCFDGNIPHVAATDYVKPRTYEEDIKVIKSWHHHEQRLQMLADHGRVCSHLTDIYPECKPAEYQKKRKGDDEQEEEAN